MSAKLKTACVIVGSALSAFAIPAAAQAGTRPGLVAPRSGESATPPSALTRSSAAADENSCGYTITWQDGYDNRYLEIYHSGLANGNWADAYPGNGTCTQQWIAVSSGTSIFFCSGGLCAQDIYGMVNANSYLCLAAPITDIGNSHVVQESCGITAFKYRWEEVSRPGGWELVQDYYDGTYQGYDTSNFVAACEDIDNHWIYTSYWYNGWSAPNCIWH